LNRTTVTIDLKSIVSNLRYVRSLAPGKKIMAVIKADAYGHGAVRVAKVMESADALAVARIEEANELRVGGIDTPICVLEGVLNKEELSRARELDLQLVVHSSHQVDLHNKFGDSVPLWLKIDSGMGRLGFHPEDITEVFERLRGQNMAGVMSHLSHADDVRSDKTARQLKILEDQIFPLSRERGLEFNLANSAGLLEWEDTITDWIRPGLMLYGISPFTDLKSRDDLQSSMTFSARVIAVRGLRKGQSVGYGGIYKTKEDMRIAVIAAGYADGYPREIKQGSPVLINKKRMPLVGRVSMDLICVDIGEENIRPGDQAILWGDSLPIEEVAKLSETIPYTLLTGISSRVTRNYQLVE